MTIISDEQNTNTEEGGDGPSLLIFQNDICRALIEELDAKWSDSGRIKLHFDTAITQFDLKTCISSR
jgi:hypothetical protein